MNGSDLRINGQHLGWLVRCGLNWEQMAQVTGRSVEELMTQIEERFYAPTSADVTQGRARRLLKQLGNSADARWLRDALRRIGRLPTEEAA